MAFLVKQLAVRVTGRARCKFVSVIFMTTVTAGCIAMQDCMWPGWTGSPPTGMRSMDGNNGNYKKEISLTDSALMLYRVLQGADDC